jgi:hypothetical protein
MPRIARPADRHAARAAVQIRARVARGAEQFHINGRRHIGAHRNDGGLCVPSCSDADAGGVHLAAPQEAVEARPAAVRDRGPQRDECVAHVILPIILEEVAVIHGRREAAGAAGVAFEARGRLPRAAGAVGARGAWERGTSGVPTVGASWARRAAPHPRLRRAVAARKNSAVGQARRNVCAGDREIVEMKLRVRARATPPT